MNASAVGVQITKSLTSLNSVADTLLRHPTVTLTLTLTKPIFTDNAPITTENKHTTYDVSCLRMSAISCVLSTESQKTIRYVSVVGELNYANTNTIHIWAYCTQEWWGRCRYDSNGSLPDNCKRPPGRPRITWLNTVQRDLRAYNLTLVPEPSSVRAEVTTLWRYTNTFIIIIIYYYYYYYGATHS